MKIGELAQRTNLAPSRIRFYEASGLISAQRHANGYRHYPAHAEHTLAIILNAQRAGFSLEEIRRFLPGNNPQGWQHDEVLSTLQHKVDEIDAMQQRLAQNKARLLEIIATIENKPEGMGCDGNAERVLAQMRQGRCGEQESAGALPAGAN